MIILYSLKNFFEHLFNAFNNALFFLVAGIAFLIGYPGKTVILTMVLVFFVLDIITKFYSLSIQNGSLIKAFFNGKISSRSFWNGFITKILGYVVVLISANFAAITPEINLIGNAIASILYIGLFFYEVISNLENLVDAGFIGLMPILKKFKKEQDKFLDNDIEEIKTLNQNTSVESKDEGSI